MKRRKPATGAQIAIAMRAFCDELGEADFEGEGVGFAGLGIMELYGVAVEGGAALDIMLDVGNGFATEVGVGEPGRGQAVERVVRTAEVSNA